MGAEYGGMVGRGMRKKGHEAESSQEGKAVDQRKAET